MGTIKINIKEIKEEINLLFWNNNLSTDYMIMTNELLNGVENVTIHID